MTLDGIRSRLMGFLSTGTGKAVALGSGALAIGGTAFALGRTTRRKSKTSRKKKKKKRTTTTRRKRTSKKRSKRPTRNPKKRIRYTSKGQPYIIQANGRARFIKKSSASRRKKLKGGYY